MSWIFGKVDEKEQERKDRRGLRTATRELATDYRQLERKEKELESQIKSLAKAGQPEACKILAKQLVQLRKQKTKNTGASTVISAVSSKNSQARSMQTMSKAMATTARTMADVNARMPVQQVAKDMREFGQQSAMMDMRGELIDETLDSMLDIDENEEERVIDQVLDEIGIETKEKLAKIPRIPAGRAVAANKASAELSNNDLEKMLAGLKN